MLSSPALGQCSSSLRPASLDSQASQNYLCLSMVKQNEIEFPPHPQSAHIELLIELIAAFQRIPQRYCMLCKAKITRLGMAGHKPACLLRRASELIEAAQQK